MIKLKSTPEIALMAKAGQIAALAREACGREIRAGMTTKQLDAVAQRVIEEHGATPSFLGYHGFKGSICCSINEQVIHGIPGPKVIKDGDIVKVDVGACYKGYHGDCADTFIVGQVPESTQKLVEVARQSFYEGIKFAREGFRISDISHAVQCYNEKHGYSLVRGFNGHGIGRDLHEDPEVPNYGPPGRGVRLKAGMTIAIEPMVNAGGYSVEILSDGWTVVTADGALSAHYENTVLITKDDPIILTDAQGIGSRHQ